MFYKDYAAFDESGGWDTVQKTFSLKAPERFNFAYDVIDRYAREAPGKEALVWCDDNGEEKIFTFGQLAKEINKSSSRGFIVNISITAADTPSFANTSAASSAFAVIIPQAAIVTSFPSRSTIPFPNSNF